MEKNQLIIYPKYSTLHIVHKPSSDLFDVEVPPNINPSSIYSNAPFETITRNGRCYLSFHIDKSSTKTSSNALEEISQIQILENIEIYIKLEKVFWTPSFILFKDSGTLSCSANVVNLSGFDFETDDIKLVFRSIDHQYTKIKDKRDIPTIDSSNFVEYKPNIPKNFVMRTAYTFCLWKRLIEMRESVRVDIEDPKPETLSSFLSFSVPELMLPGEIETVYRLKNGDLLHLGTVYSRLYLKDEIIKILFPMNKSIKVRSSIETSSHSFFSEKTMLKMQSTMSKLYQHPLTVEFFSHRPIKSSKPEPSFTEDNIYIWSLEMKEKELKFTLEISF
jgi:hypothetical protein